MVLSLDEYPPAARDDLDPNPTTTHLLCEGRERERVGDHRSLMFLNMKAMKQVRTLEPSLFGRSEHKKHLLTSWWLSHVRQMLFPIKRQQQQQQKTSSRSHGLRLHRAVKNGMNFTGVTGVAIEFEELWL